MLKELGIVFEVINNVEVEETYPDDLDRKQIPVYLAEKKARAFEGLLDENTLIISADTIVWSDNKVYNKPAGRDEAINMLQELSGRKHQVISGVCLLSINKKISFNSLTTVCFRELDAEEIIYYVDKFKPFDKAGSYGIQEWIGYVGIESIKGSFFNVMGLPVNKLYKELVDF